MTDLYTITPAILTDQRVVMLKSNLMAAVAQEMQKHSLPQHQSREMVQQWLADALSRMGV